MATFILLTSIQPFNVGSLLVNLLVQFFPLEK